MDQQIISNTSNVLYSFECIFKKGEDGQWNSKDRALRKKLAKIQAFVERHSNMKTKIVPWHVQAMKAAMQHHMGGGIVYLPKKALVVAVLGFGNEGGYGEIHKVCISRVASIPTIVDFAGKMSKAVNEVDKRVEYEYITRHPDHLMDVLEKIKAFCTKHAKLTMSLIMSMAHIH
jgi:hypothetical protein